MWRSKKAQPRTGIIRPVMNRHILQSSLEGCGIVNLKNFAEPTMSGSLLTFILPSQLSKSETCYKANKVGRIKSLGSELVLHSLSRWAYCLYIICLQGLAKR